MKTGFNIIIEFYKILKYVYNLNHLLSLAFSPNRLNGGLLFSPITKIVIELEKSSGLFSNI